ncbi:hypothetical protein Tco_0295847 [Tanacetum coccineum]
MPTEMELTLEQTQQGVSYEVSFDESNTHVLERFYTSAGNPVKEILLKLNLPDHRILKDDGEDFRNSDTERLSRSNEVLKLKNFKKDATLKLSKSTNQEWYEHVGPEVTRSQDDKYSSVRKNNGAPIIEDWVSDNEEENVSYTKIEKKTTKTSFVKINFVKAKQTNKTDRKNAKQVEHNRQNTHIPRGNKRNWNNMMSQSLGSNFEMFNKACYVCGSFDHLQVDCNYQMVIKPV